jgi:hypothetical protein
VLLKHIGLYVDVERHTGPCSLNAAMLKCTAVKKFPQVKCLLLDQQKKKRVS